MPSLKIGVSSAETTYNNGVPKFGEWETHYEITQKKESGYVLADDAIIGSVPAPKVLAKAAAEVGNKVVDTIDSLLPKKGDDEESSEAEEPATSAATTEGEPTGSNQ